MSESKYNYKGAKMTLKDILQQAMKETHDMHVNKPCECECNCDTARENIQHIIINTEHVMFEIKVTSR